MPAFDPDEWVVADSDDGSQIGIRVAEVDGELVATGVLFLSDGPIPSKRDLPKHLRIRELLELARTRRVEQDLTSSPRVGRHPGRRGYDRQHDERFAEDYRVALERTASKNEALSILADHYGRDTSTLYRWVDRCVDAGLLTA